MRKAWYVMVLLGVGLFTHPSRTEAPREAYRMITGLDLGVFGCPGNPVFYLISSEEDLTRQMELRSVQCRPSDVSQLKARLLDSLRSHDIRWEEESLVLLQEYYGTGMAKAHLELILEKDGILDAKIVWIVPPPPVTPDTVVFSFAFAVKKSMVTQVRVRGRSSETSVLIVQR
jgi:nitrate reductase NapAB chaperone NapD